MELTLPPAATRAPLGLLLIKGNGNPDMQRRKLWLGADDVLHHAEPHVGRRASIELLLQPADLPYVLVPYSASAGFESPFLLTVLSDDRDEDGKPDFGLAPLRPATDWHILRMQIPWDKAASPPGSDSFRSGVQLKFTLARGQVPKGRVFAFLDTIGVATDARTTVGMQEGGAQYPAIGMGLAASAGGPEPLSALPASAHVQPAVARDGVSFGAELEAGPSHVLVPFLGEGEAAQLAAAGATPQIVVTLYSDLPLSLSDAFDDSVGAADCLDPCSCPICSADGKKRASPYFHVLGKMERLEAIMDHRIAYLNQALGAAR